MQFTFFSSIALWVCFPSSIPAEILILIGFSHYGKCSDILDEISWDGFFFFFFLQHSEFMVGVINLENDDSLTWKLSLYYHNNHFYLFLLFVIFSVSSTVTMQIDVLLLKQSLPDVFRSSSSYFILISWKFSDIVYSPATINKHPLVSVMNFHGV